MAEQNSGLWTVLVVGGLGYLVWRMHERNQAAAAAAQPTTMMTSDLPPTTGVPGTGIPIPSQGLPVAMVNVSPPNGIPPPQYDAVQQWATEDGRAPVLQMAAAAVPSEYAGMYDIITNFWDKGVTRNLPPAQTLFWNNLRAKYDPGDAIW